MLRDGFGRGGFGRRRFGVPLIGTGGMSGTGSPLLTGLMTGGIGYLLGSNTNQPAVPHGQPVIQVPVYQPPVYQPPAYQPPPTSGGNIKQLTQFMLGVLHDSGVLTDEEFVREENHLLNQ